MVRAAAADALGQLDDPAALSQLARAAESDDSAAVRAAAAQALGSLKTPLPFRRWRKLPPRTTTRRSGPLRSKPWPSWMTPMQ